MCIMEVRLGQRDSTIAQALAHNTGTILADIGLFRPVLRARHPEMLEVLDEFEMELSRASSTATNLWARLVEYVVAAEGGDPHTHAHEHAGNERWSDLSMGGPSTPAAREDAEYGAYADDDFGDLIPQVAEAAEEQIAAQDMASAANYETRK